MLTAGGPRGRGAAAGATRMVRGVAAPPRCHLDQCAAWDWRGPEHPVVRFGEQAAAKKARMEAQRLKAEKEAADRRVGSAATKLQAANRGRSQRKLLEDKKEEATRLEAEAAEQQRLVEQIAAAKAKRLEASRITSEKDEADRVLASAAARLQASERGRSQRARDVKKTNETPPDLHHPDPASIRSGDVVRVLLGGLGMEGVVADDHAGTDHTQLAVDFGDGDVEVVPREACALVRPWHALEVGDHAQVKALDSELRSLALVTQIGCDASGLTRVRRADLRRTNRGGAAAATWMFL